MFLPTNLHLRLLLYTLFRTYPIYLVFLFLTCICIHPCNFTIIIIRNIVQVSRVETTITRYFYAVHHLNMHDFIDCAGGSYNSHYIKLDVFQSPIMLLSFGATLLLSLTISKMSLLYFFLPFLFRYSRCYFALLKLRVI